MEKVNINKAGFQELQRIKHIGPKRAQKIINHRQIKPFGDRFELSKLIGLGEIRMTDIFAQDIITF